MSMGYTNVGAARASSMSMTETSERTSAAPRYSTRHHPRPRQLVCVRQGGVEKGRGGGERKKGGNGSKRGKVSDGSEDGVRRKEGERTG